MSTPEHASSSGLVPARSVLPLGGVLRHFSWGSRDALASLLGSTPSGEPEAEFWMGAHPSAPSVVCGAGGSDVTLDAAIAADPDAMLGPAIAATFDGLPFLFKFLAAAEPLSIQVHPSQAAAAAGFARENAAQVALDAPTRVYRDPFHKPELICALEPFAVLCGFRPLDAVRAELAAAPGRHLQALAEVIGRSLPPAEAVTSALVHLLRLGPVEARALNLELAALPRSEVYAQLRRHHPDDPGVGVAVLMNHVVLAPGEALFLSAGTLHAYLGGVAVEVMANSDNVVRGGLTPKHIDVDELLANLDARPQAVVPERPSGRVHHFAPPVAEFTLTRAELDPGDELVVEGPAIVVAVVGGVGFDGPGIERVVAARGRPHFVPAAVGPVVLTPGPGDHARPDGGPTLVFVARCDPRRR